jgi:hypothetical protein
LSLVIRHEAIRHFIRRILVPGWILSFGIALASAPPLGVASTLALFAAGILVVPAVALALTVDLPARTDGVMVVDSSTGKPETAGVVFEPSPQAQ